jgi:hypothetical protein
MYPRRPDVEPFGFAVYDQPASLCGRHDAGGQWPVAVRSQSGLGGPECCGESDTDSQGCERYGWSHPVALPPWCSWNDSISPEQRSGSVLPGSQLGKTVALIPADPAFPFPSASSCSCS